MTRDEQIAALYRQGRSQHEIGQIVGISQPGVRKRLIRLGLLAPVPKNRSDKPCEIGSNSLSHEGKADNLDKYKVITSAPDNRGDISPEVVSDNRTGTKDEDPIPPEELADAWNQCIAPRGCPPVPVPLAPQLRQKAEELLKEHSDMEFWVNIFRKVRDSQSLRGPGVTFAWFLDAVRERVREEPRG